MRRIFGAAKKEAPAPTLDETGEKLQGRGDKIDENIAKLDAQLVKFREQIAKTRPGRSNLSFRACHALPFHVHVLRYTPIQLNRTNTGWNQATSSTGAEAEEALRISARHIISATVQHRADSIHS